jgi:hypothetical protein
VNERQRRAAQNEAMFREVNERIDDLDDRFGVSDGTIVVICECGRVDCTAQIELSRREYEEIRSDSATFALVPGHEDPDVEEVVRRAANHLVVRKRPGEPERIAEETDPRA